MDETKEKLQQIVNCLEGAKSVETAHLIFNSVGACVPLVGALVAKHTEASQTKLNEAIYSVLDAHDDAIAKLWDAIFDTRPSKAQFVMLFEEVTGLPMPATFEAVSEIYIFLNPATVTEFNSYVRLGWIEIKPFGNNLMSLGCNNVISGYIEDHKNPYGLGNSFKMVVKKAFFL